MTMLDLIILAAYFFLVKLGVFPISAFTLCVLTLILVLERFLKGERL